MATTTAATAAAADASTTPACAAPLAIALEGPAAELEELGEAPVLRDGSTDDEADAAPAPGEPVLVAVLLAEPPPGAADAVTVAVGRVPLATRW